MAVEPRIDVPHPVPDMAANTDAGRTFPAVAPLVHRADRDSEVLGQAIWAEKVNGSLVHILTVRHTLCHCLSVARKTEQPSIVRFVGPTFVRTTPLDDSPVAFEDFDVDPSSRATYTMHTPDLPGWEVTVVLSARGGEVEELHLTPQTEARLVRQGGIRYRGADGEEHVFERRCPHCKEFIEAPQRRIFAPMAAPEGGLTTRLLRRVRVGELLRTVQAEVTEESIQDPTRGNTTWAKKLAAPRPGRRGRPDHEYLSLVLRYLTLIDKGDATPVATLARRAHLSESQVRNLLYEARRRDLLTAAPKGRPGGRLTDKARTMLDQQKGADGGQHRQAND